MRLLVACPQLLFLVDSRSREWSVVEDHRPGYYGISWTTDGQHLALSHTGLPYGLGHSLEAYIESERGHFSLGDRRGVEGLSVPHQILCTDDHVLITNTGRNCLTQVDQKDLFYRHVWLDDVRWDCKGSDNLCGMHLNSVFLRGDRLFVLAHGQNRGSRIAELSWPGMEVVRWYDTKAFQAHNLWALPGGELLTCNTLDGSVIDALTGQIVWKADGPNLMTRGLACAGGYVFVGQSKFAQRKDRLSTDGGVWVLDRATWKEIDFIPLPVAGNVHEVRVVDEPDECHHGHVLKNVPAANPSATEAHRVKVAAKAEAVKAGAAWVVHVGDPVFKVGSVEAGAGSLTLATVGGVSAADVSVTARLEAEVTADHRHAGLVARYAGPGDLNMVCALVEVVAPHPYASLWQSVHGEWKQLARVRIGALPADLRLDAVGNYLTLYVGGRKLLTAKTAVLTPGGVGVRGLTGRFNGFAADALLPGGRRQPLFPPPADSRAA